MSNRTKNQHFVSRFYLRRFSSDVAQERIWVHDRRTGQVFNPSIENVGSENMFFSDPSIEGRVTKFENIVLPVYNSVIDRFAAHDYEPLNFRERAGLAL